MSVKFTVKGNTNRTRSFLQKITRGDVYSDLESLARRGVDALSSATPASTGLTAASWTYEIVRDKDKTSIWWKNTNIQDGANIAILLQYGHATGTGGYVAGRDYINPALKPIFDEIANSVWKKVTSA